MNSVPRCFLLMVMLWPAAVARADITSTSYLALVAQDRQIDVQWSLALRDLEDAVGLDSNGDGEITWGELRAASDRITAYAHPRLRFTSAGIECPAGEAQLLVDRLGGTPYAVLRYTARCPTAITNLDVVYAAFFEIDARHRGLASVTLSGTRHAAVFSPGQPSAHFAATGNAVSVM